MWFKIAITTTEVSVAGIDYPVQEGFLELPDDLERGILKYLLDNDYEEIPESQVPDRFKGPKLPPPFADAHCPADFPYYGKRST